jgi:DNA-binding IclR family transcriptional regulator
LRAELEETRRRGYSVSDEDVTPGIGAIGAPVLGSDGRALAAVSIGGLRSRVLPPQPGHIARLVQACGEISARLSDGRVRPGGASTAP